jgi:hypothetical protein
MVRALVVQPATGWRAFTEVRLVEWRGGEVVEVLARRYVEGNPYTDEGLAQLAVIGAELLGDEVPS